MDSDENKVEPRALRWVIDAVQSGAEVRSVQRLKGGISSLVHGITLEVNSVTKDFVLRQFNNEEWLRSQPDLAVREAASLRRASRAEGVLTPEVVAIDETGSECGMPAVLMTKLEGRVVLAPPDISAWLAGMAEALVRIHAVEPDDFLWTFEPYCDASTLDTSSWSAFPGKWRTAAEVVVHNRPAFTKRFIHRDYHPTNLLWSGNEISGVVDWVNGCIGPAGVDVGHCRVNLAQLYGVSAADAFLDFYREYAGSSFTYDPYWDLVTLIDFSYWPPEVYSGWTDLGVTGLTNELIIERLDHYLLSLLNRL